MGNSGEISYKVKKQSKQILLLQIHLLCIISIHSYIIPAGSVAPAHSCIIPAGSVAPASPTACA